jgi:hypothetical protein
MRFLFQLLDRPLLGFGEEQRQIVDDFALAGRQRLTGMPVSDVELTVQRQEFQLRQVSIIAGSRLRSRLDAYHFVHKHLTWEQWTSFVLGADRFAASALVSDPLTGAYVGSGTNNVLWQFFARRRSATTSLTPR